jgi:H-NS histone family protein
LENYGFHAVHSEIRKWLSVERLGGFVKELFWFYLDEEYDEHLHAEGEVYRHPTDANLVWTAQPGRKPNWLRQLLREGHKLEDLRVQNAASSVQPIFSLGDYGR